MSFRPVFYVVGLLLCILSGLMLIPIVSDLLFFSIDTHEAFAVSAGITIITGLLLVYYCKPKHFSLRPREMFLLTNVVWLSLCVFGALPFVLQMDMSFTDAFFETMSGITTTGSTVLTGLDTMNPAILLWRSELQWLGGIGFVVVAVAILPFLRVGGMRLFQSESSDWSDKAIPRSRVLARKVVELYIGLSFACALAYFLGGMTVFEAINHAMTTLSTGGFSTSDASMGHFSNPAIQWTGALFMLLGSLPFVLLVRFLSGKTDELYKDVQVRLFFKGLIGVWVFLTVWLLFNSDYSIFEALTLVAFNTTSVVSTTGYAFTDYTLWGGFAGAFIFFLSFVGGCSGSTAGGVKVFRFQIGMKVLNNQLKLLSHPRACFNMTYNGQTMTPEIIRSFSSFSFFFLVLVSIVTLLLCFMGVDFMTSLSGAVTAIANVGPGIGDTIGPAGNFATLPDAAKWVLAIAMLMGRLEIMTVLVLFTPICWKN